MFVSLIIWEVPILRPTFWYHGFTASVYRTLYLLRHFHHIRITGTCDCVYRRIYFEQGVFIWSYVELIEYVCIIMF